MRLSLPAALPLLLPGLPLRAPPPRLQFVADEPKLADFAVRGSPTIISASSLPSYSLAASLDVNSTKPMLLYCPGIELTGYSLHRQVAELSNDFDVSWLAVPTEDRSDFSQLVDVVFDAVEAANRSVYLVGESFGGVLALSVALRNTKPPAGLAGLVLINPATSVTRSWPARLPGLLDAVASLPAGASDLTYQALATPIFAAISGDPLQLGRRRSDAGLPPPIALANTVGRLAGQLPEITALPNALPLDTLAYRLDMLTKAAEASDKLKLGTLRLPVQILCSTEDKVLPSSEEGKRLARILPNARVTLLEESGHVPLLEARVALADVLRDVQLTERAALPKKDYVVDFKPPTAEQFENASRTLSAVRKVTSPVFLSTTPGGRRISGLGGLPKQLWQPTGNTAPADGRVAPPTDAKTTPTLFIGNHQLYGFLDLPMLVEEVYRQTGSLVRGLAHPVAFPTNRNASGNEGRGGGGGGFVDFETFGAVPVNPRALFKLMQRGEPALLYPGGVREAFKSTKKGEAYKLFWPDEEETSDFARVAARFNATVVPVAAIGAEDGFEMLLDADELLELPYFGQRVAEGAKKTPVGRPGERFVSPVSVPKLPGRYYFLFGSPIDTSAVDPTDKEACAALYGSIKTELEASLDYLLEKRQADPYEAPLPRVAAEASWNWTRQVPTFTIG